MNRLRLPRGRPGPIAAITLLLSWILTAGTAQGQTLLCGESECGPGDTNATGIRDLPVGGGMDVEFVVDSADGIWGPSPAPFDWNTIVKATEAATAVEAALDRHPDVVTVGPQMEDRTRIPYERLFGPSLASLDVAFFGNPDNSWVIDKEGIYPESESFTYAVFTPASGEPPPPDSDPDDRMIDLVTLGDVGGSSDVDLAMLDVALQNGDQLSARVHVRDGGTGDEIYQVDVSGSWRSLAIDTLIGYSGPLLAILQTNSNGDIRVQALNAEDGAYAKNVAYFDNTWRPIDIFSVSDAGGPGVPGIGVLAENQEGRPAVEVHKAGNGELVERVFYFSNVWRASDAIDLGEFNGNGYSEMAVLATNNAGKHAVETRDALSGKQISRHFFLGPTNTVIGVADVADLTNNGRPELAVLGNKPANDNTANTLQAKDVKTGDLIGKVGTYGPDFVGGAIRSIGDVDGNSAEEVVVAVLNIVDNTTSVSVRDAPSNSFTSRISFLNPDFTPQDVEVLGDVSGNSIQEVVVGGVNKDNLSVLVEVRDASTGSLIHGINFN